jgi:hypothetical protein
MDMSLPQREVNHMRLIYHSLIRVYPFRFICLLWIHMLHMKKEAKHKCLFINIFIIVNARDVSF